MENFNQTSREPLNALRLRVKGGEWEFEAEGDRKSVAQQFDKFQQLVHSCRAIVPQTPTSQLPQSENPPVPSFKTDDRPLPPLDRTFETDPHSSLLLCRTPPSGQHREANLVLLLLLGYRELRGVNDVPVLALKEAIKQCLHPVLRLDRILHDYAKDRFVLKIGRGKGGKYRLTPLGIIKASAIAAQVASEWNQV